MKLKYFLFFSLLFSILFLNACNKSTDFENKIYFSQSVSSPSVSMSLEEGVGHMDLSLVSAKKASDILHASVEVLDSNYLKEFNKSHNTNYKIAPLSAISFSSQHLTIPKGEASSDSIFEITVDEWEGYVDGVHYAIPLKLNSKAGMVLPGNEVTIITISKVINTSAAQNSGFELDSTIMGEGTLGQPLDEVTIEGKFMLTQNLIVPGNWRTDIFVGFGMQLCVFSSGGIDVRLPNSAFMFNENPPIKTTLNSWTHFGLTYKNGTVTLYINGEQSGSPYSYPGLTINEPTIAGWITNTGCTVSEFRIWNYVRTKRELQTYMCAVDPHTSGLMGYWKFNEGHGNKIEDATGNGHDLTATGNITWIEDVKCP